MILALGSFFSTNECVAAFEGKRFWKEKYNYRKK